MWHEEQVRERDFFALHPVQPKPDEWDAWKPGRDVA